MTRTYYTTATIVKDRLSQIDTTNLTDAKIEENIRQAEGIVDSIMRQTFRTVSDSGTASSGASSSLTDSGKAWTTDQYTGYSVVIHSGTGSGQIRRISSNTSDKLTVNRDWSTNPDGTSEYEIFNFDELNQGIIRDTATCMAAFLCLMYDVTQFTNSALLTALSDMLWSETDRNLAILADPKVMDYLEGL